MRSAIASGTDLSSLQNCHGVEKRARPHGHIFLATHTDFVGLWLFSHDYPGGCVVFLLATVSDVTGGPGVS
jgi:hypothetical protein